MSYRTVLAATGSCRALGLVSKHADFNDPAACRHLPPGRQGPARQQRPPTIPLRSQERAPLSAQRPLELGPRAGG